MPGSKGTHGSLAFIKNGHLDVILMQNPGNGQSSHPRTDNCNTHGRTCFFLFKFRVIVLGASIFVYDKTGDMENGFSRSRFVVLKGITLGSFGVNQ